MLLFDQLTHEAPAPQTAVLSIDWNQYVKLTPEARPFVSRLLAAGDASGSGDVGPFAPSSSLAERLMAAPSASRQGLVAAHVRGCALKVLGLPPSYPLDVNQGLRDVGLDSLMAVELRNVLQASVGATLPATLAFDYPTVAALVQYRIDRRPAPDSRQCASGGRQARWTLAGLFDRRQPVE